MSSPVTVKSIPAPEEPVPALSLPAVGLFIGGLALWFVSTWMAVADVWPWPLSTLLNAVASFLLFTVAHDAGHRSLSTSEAVNTWMGRVATFFFAPPVGFQTWRYIHMQHHLFTNHEDGRDPDAYTQAGPRWQVPLRWLTIDLAYMLFYLRRLRTRPRRELMEFAVTVLVFGVVVVVAIATGHLLELVVLYLLPIRLAIMWLGFAFDYLPHHGLHDTPESDKFRTTRNRVGLEWLMSPLLLYQNYHLVHHLHPLVPFHRYLAVWRRGEDRYLKNDPALATVGGRPITPDEYKRLRELANAAGVDVPPASHT